MIHQQSIHSKAESKVILLVEDNPDDAELSVRALRENNVANEIIVARDGAEALDYLSGKGTFGGRNKHVMPVIVLLDLNLPKFDGLEVLRRIRADERTNNLPVAILTSSKEEMDLVNSYKLGAISYIRKPIDINKFDRVLRELAKNSCCDMKQFPIFKT